MGVVSEAVSPEMAYADSPEQDNDVGVVSLATNLDLCQVIIPMHGLVTPDDVERLFELITFYLDSMST
ncbi:hypothetical protein K439DRAFT_1641982 [Ramaria rubella]|nr:hypothetical protein K439DRAFT_1641982 [Ramaria rubella]